MNLPNYIDNPLQFLLILAQLQLKYVSPDLKSLMLGWRDDSTVRGPDFDSQYPCPHCWLLLFSGPCRHPYAHDIWIIRCIHINKCRHTVSYCEPDKAISDDNEGSLPGQSFTFVIIKAVPAHQPLTSLLKTRLWAEFSGNFADLLING